MKLLLVNLSVCSDNAIHIYKEAASYLGLTYYDGWNFNSGNYLFTTDTK